MLTRAAHTNARAATVACACLAIASCTSGAPLPTPRATIVAEPPTAPAAPQAAPPSAPLPPLPRPQLDGRAFPDRVLALTYDDGPDARTLDLARYLRERRVSATFFVVGEWSGALSSEPGRGSRVFQTGHAWLPVLGAVVALGHRLGNHTQHHVLLTTADAQTIQDELATNQRALDPLLGNELRLFRPPAGAWSDSASAAVDSDAYVARLRGPFLWDIDRKDWEDSLFCRSDRGATECEAARPTSEARVRPAVVAQRYLDSIESARRGIVLFHDRVGHVGSDYALSIARALVPALEARGYVFAAPVLRFSPLEERGDAGRWTSLEITDVDGDGRGDVCGRAQWGASCLRSVTTTLGYDRLPHTLLVATTRTPGRPPDPTLADVDGDGRVDHCERRHDGIACARGTPTGFAAPERWSTGKDFADDGPIAWSRAPYASTIRFADLNGDGRDDVCGRGPDGLVCALSNGRSFLKATVWAPELSDAAGWLADGGAIALGDINGDGRSDVCARRATTVLCGIAP